MEIDATYGTVWGIPSYIFFVGIGIVLAFLVFNGLIMHYDVDPKMGNRAVILALPALLIGAKTFGIIANIGRCVAYDQPINLNTFLYSGIVFYGGLIFFTLCFLFLIRKSSFLIRQKISDSLAVSIPLFHALGRVGCFTAGCCYGITTNSSFGITYKTWVNGVLSTERRVPIQLIEAFTNMVLFLVLLWMVLHKKQQGNLLTLYILLYASIRWFDEFLRGDTDKCILSKFSVAQVISIVLIVIIISKRIKLTKGRNSKNVQT